MLVLWDTGGIIVGGLLENVNDRTDDEVSNKSSSVSCILIENVGIVDD